MPADPTLPVQYDYWKAKREAARFTVLRATPVTCRSCGATTSVGAAVDHAWRWQTSGDLARPDELAPVCGECVEDGLAGGPLRICSRCLRFLDDEATFDGVAASYCRSFAAPAEATAWLARLGSGAAIISCGDCGRRRSLQRAIESAWRFHGDADLLAPDGLQAVCWQCAGNSPRDDDSCRFCQECGIQKDDYHFYVSPDLDANARNTHCATCTNQDAF